MQVIELNRLDKSNTICTAMNELSDFHVLACLKFSSILFFVLTERKNPFIFIDVMVRTFGVPKQRWKWILGFVFFLVVYYFIHYPVAWTQMAFFNPIIVDPTEEAYSYYIQEMCNATLEQNFTVVAQNIHDGDTGFYNGSLFI